MKTKILIIGACGQIGSELTLSLRALHGNDCVIASDIREGNYELIQSGPFEILDAKNFDQIKACVIKHEITDVYLLAAMLSATGEKYPMIAWDLNMTSLFNVLNLAKEQCIQKVFWPSSIAVFGSTTPRENTPQYTVMEPATVYGITKQTGERWCEYYHNNYGVDVRSIRYPGIISWKTLPGGGTTDYAVEIFYEAIKNKSYTCFLSQDTALPMMYMDDAVKATMDVMKAPKEAITIRSSYNLAAISFTPEELAAEIKKRIPEFRISYTPDFRQKIADSWPQSIEDTQARNDWQWAHAFGLERMVDVMLDNLG
jgi:nucleoside-diphosphate-sugar epimerase